MVCGRDAGSASAMLWHSAFPVCLELAPGQSCAGDTDPRSSISPLPLYLLHVHHFAFFPFAGMLILLSVSNTQYFFSVLVVVTQYYHFFISSYSLCCNCGTDG